MLYTLEQAKANIRTREGKRVFFLGEGDTLTSAAKDHLAAERIPILPASQAKITRYLGLDGGYYDEKPEHMTQLEGNVLVPKTHPRITFRGKLDTLQAQAILLALEEPELKEPLRVTARTRYHQTEQAATVYPAGNGFRLEFEQPQRAPTPGQSVVLYQGDVVLGGGTIVAVE